MPAAKVAITIDARLLREVDGWVAAGEFSSRSRVIQEALHQLKQQRAGQQSLLGELAKLDPIEEQSLADERLAGDAPWPAY